METFASDSNGAGDGQFLGSKSIAVDSSGNVYVSDALNGRIQKFDSNGNYLVDYPLYGAQTGMKATNFSVDSRGNIIAKMGGNGYGDFNFKVVQFHHRLM